MMRDLPGTKEKTKTPKLTKAPETSTTGLVSRPKSVRLGSSLRTGRVDQVVIAWMTIETAQERPFLDRRRQNEG